MKKWIVIIVVVVVAIGWMVYKRATSSVPVQVATVERGEIRAFIDERAKTTLPHVWRLTMPLDGRIAPIALDSGDPVTKGQVVARLDIADLDTAVAEAQARVDEIDAQIAVNRDSSIETTAEEEIAKWIHSVAATVQASDEKVKASKVRFEFADWWLKTVEKLYEAEAENERGLREARTEQAESKVNLRADEFTSTAMQAVKVASQIWPRYITQYLKKKDLERDVLDKQRQAAAAALERARRDRDRAELASPIDGVVLKRHISNRRLLPADTPLLEIGDLNQLEVTAEVLSQDAVAIRNGNEVDIFGPSIGPEPIKGTVKRIEPQGFTKLSSLGVEQQRVEVVITIDPQQLKAVRDIGRSLGVNYRVRVRIYTAQADGAMVLPRTCLFRGSAGQWRVFAVRNGEARLVDVTVGLTNDREVQIVDGLAAEDTVIIAPEATLTDGQRVSDSKAERNSN